MKARTMVQVDFQADVKGADGYQITFRMDDSLRGWWSIVRWNIHYHHWRPLFTSNAPDLFRKVLWRKLWRHSA